MRRVWNNTTITMLEEMEENWNSAKENFVRDWKQDNPILDNPRG